MSRFFLLVMFMVSMEATRGEGSSSCHGKGEGHAGVSRPRPSDGGQCDTGNTGCSAGIPSSEMVLIPGGEYVVGTDDPVIPADFEGPSRKVHVDSFFINKYEVSNSDFAKFIKDTEYVTDAEYFKDSFVFHSVLSEELRQKYKDFRAVGAEWWYKVPGANWQFPEGGKRSIQELELLSHPVVHVSWHDAVAYCKWKTNGGRLPTEIEWETACRGGKNDKLYPWGNKLMPKEKHWTNIWQGEFPDFNDASDGYKSTCPVDEFPPQNAYGLHNMVGNVWEWTSSHWTRDNSTEDMVKKGGSFLCHHKFCFRYRCAARSSNTADSTAANLGFRCALNAEKH